jgi:hypothetical protein
MVSNERSSYVSEKEAQADSEMSRFKTLRAETGA